MSAQQITVRLSWFEVFHGACVGTMREIEARKRGRPTYFESDDTWGGHVEAACAEMVVAKTFNRYWHGFVEEPKTLPGDVGTYQVRHTIHQGGHLILYEKDQANMAVILVVGTAPTYEIRGWYRKGEESEDWWRIMRGHRACWVPQSKLRPLAELSAGGGAESTDPSYQERKRNDEREQES